VTEGQVIGQSAPNGGEPAADPYGNSDLLATIMANLFNVGELRITSRAPPEIIRAITAGRPIQGLI
jgi:hypothetical protein